MKTLSRFKSLVIAALFIFANIAAFSQSYEASKTLSKNIAVPADVTLKISNQSGDIDFTTTNDNTVSIQTEVKVNAKSKEDADKLIKAIENFDFNLNGKVLSIDTRFYKSMQSNNSKTTLTLNNGDKIRIKDFSISHKISIPKSANLNLENKYSDINMESLDGELSLQLYNTNLKGYIIYNDVVINGKYSKISFQKFTKNVDLNLYDTDIKFYECANLQLISKYSKVEVEKMDNVKAESYDDKYLLDEMNAFAIDAKYTDLKIRIGASTAEMELYDCDVYLEHANTLTFSGKYCDFKMAVNTLNISDSYDNDFYFYKVKDIKVTKSKYSKYLADWCSSVSINESYDDEIKINKLNPDFSGITLNGRYTKLNVTTGSVPFKIDVNMKYGKVDIPESIKISKHIEKSSQLEILGGESGGTVSIRGFDNTIVIK